MNTNKLKAFARAARTKLIDDVTAKLNWVLSHKDSNAELLGNRKGDVVKLEERIARVGVKQLVDEVAYTWFNRLMALRFMDANGYNIPCVVTPSEGMTFPEILQEAKSGHIDDKFNVVRVKITDLFDGRVIATSGNPETDVYRMLLVSACNSWNGAMPFMFEQLNSYIDLLLSDDLLGDNSIVKIIRESMSDEDCQQEEIIGWLYQFYIAELKEDVEPRKASKFGLKAEEIPAATQLFTPHWIVRYMVENSLGRIWMTLHPDSPLKKQMSYYIDEIEGQISPIPTDIKSTKDIRFIDPCMGSGHVLVYAFELLCKMYEEEGYSTSDIPTLILENNIFGIDIDPRCTQLANFALTMKAQSYYRRYLRRAVKPNAIALSNITKESIDECGDFGSTSTIYLLTQADNLGSLISISESDYNKISTTEGELFSSESTKLKEMALMLSQKYHCVVTNPPYLGKGLNPILKSFMGNCYPNSKSDLYAAFIDHCLQMLTPNGLTGLVTMESWMFLSSYEKLRKSIVDNSQIVSLSHFDWHIMRIAFGTVSFILQNCKPDGNKGVYSYLSRKDVDLEKELPFIFPKKNNGRYNVVDQNNFRKIPGSPIGYWMSDKMIEIFERLNSLADNGDARQGMATSDNNRFLRLWSEVEFSNVGLLMANIEEAQSSGCKWFPYNKGGEKRRWYGNQEYLINWEGDGHDVKGYAKKLYKSYTRTIKNIQRYFKPSISWSDVTSGSNAFRYYPKGFLFDIKGMSYFNDSINYILIGWLNGKIIDKLTKLLNPTLSFQVGDFRKLPYTKIEDTILENLVKDCIFVSVIDWNAHETSWDFKQNELTRLRKACGEGDVLLEFLYNEFTIVWEEKFRQLHFNEEELNRQFIDIYGLQDEFTPDVPLKEITILQQREIKIENNEIVFQPDVVLKQFMSYAVGCMMGRYSIDEAGLILANQGEGVAEYLEKVPNPTFMPDDDGIIPVLEGEYFLDDLTERFKLFLITVFGEQYCGENLNFILAHVGDIRKYFYKDFYNDHVKMYKKRPIYWMFSSPKKSFQVLVYMHRMRSDTPSKVFSDYLQPYIHKLEGERHTLQNELLRADITPREKTSTNKRVDQLSKMLLDCEEYARTLLAFASTRPTIDLDDGVKVNYTKFKGIVTKIVGLD